MANTPNLTALIFALCIAIILHQSELVEWAHLKQWFPNHHAQEDLFSSIIATGRGDNCTTVSHMTRYSTARRWRESQRAISFSTSPVHDWEKPRIEPLNSTAGEQWEFDGISVDGKQSFIFGFSRDPSWAFLGTGNLRVSAEFALANGTRYAIVDYAEESTIETCHSSRDGGYSYTLGTWRGPNFQYSFEIASDSSRATVHMANPEARATIVMNAIAPPRYADNTIWSPDMDPARQNASSTTAAPHFHWVEPIPAAVVMLDAVIEGQTVRWEPGGLGGHERLWYAFNWPTCLEGMLAVRLHVGPYALSLIDFTSSDMTGRLHAPAVILVHDGRQIFASRLEKPSSRVDAGGGCPDVPANAGHGLPASEIGREDYICSRKLYGSESGGITTGRLSDKATGVHLTLVSPSQGKRWEFTVTHHNIGFEHAFTDGSGGTGYSGTATGGLVWDAGQPVSEKHRPGPAFVEILRFPEKSWFFTRSNRS